jgi:hypothetical protein
MSAFLVDKRTIDKILTHINSKITDSYWLNSQFEEKLGVNFAEYDWEDNLGQAMWNLNQLSLRYRYGDRKKKLVYKFEPVLSSPIEALKALQCWSYQCAEGSIPERSKLYKFFKNVVESAWAKSIIMRTPEYDNAA